MEVAAGGTGLCPFFPCAASCWHGDELQSSLSPSLTAPRSECRQDRSHLDPNFMHQRNAKDNGEVISLHVHDIHCIAFVSLEVVILCLFLWFLSAQPCFICLTTHSCSCSEIFLHLLWGCYFFRIKVELEVGLFVEKNCLK